MKFAPVTGACLSNSSQVNFPLLVSMTACRGPEAGPDRPLVASASVKLPWLGSPSSARTDDRPANEMTARERAKQPERITRSPPDMPVLGSRYLNTQHLAASHIPATRRQCRTISAHAPPGRSAAPAEPVRATALPSAPSSRRWKASRPPGPTSPEDSRGKRCNGTRTDRGPEPAIAGRRRASDICRGRHRRRSPDRGSAPPSGRYTRRPATGFPQAPRLRPVSRSARSTRLARPPFLPERKRARQRKRTLPQKRKSPGSVRIRGFKNFRRRPTLPQGFPCSTIGPGGLNFRVRDGIGCDPSGETAEPYQYGTLKGFHTSRDGLGPAKPSLPRRDSSSAEHLRLPRFRARPVSPVGKICLECRNQAARSKNFDLNIIDGAWLPKRKVMVAKPHDRLVPVSSTPYSVSTPGLSTSSSTRGL